MFWLVLVIQTRCSTSVLSWQPGGDKMIQLKHGGGRLRLYQHDEAWQWGKPLFPLELNGNISNPFSKQAALDQVRGQVKHAGLTNFMSPSYQWNVLAPVMVRMDQPPQPLSWWRSPVLTRPHQVLSICTLQLHTSCALQCTARFFLPTLLPYFQLLFHHLCTPAFALFSAPCTIVSTLHLAPSASQTCQLSAHLQRLFTAFACRFSCLHVPWSLVNKRTFVKTPVVLLLVPPLTWQ